jgi:hypothetical protein
MSTAQAIKESFHRPEARLRNRCGRPTAEREVSRSSRSSLGQV